MAKWRQAGPNGAKLDQLDQTGSNGAKQGQTGLNGANRAKLGQIGPNEPTEAKWGQLGLTFCMQAYFHERKKIMFSNQGPQTKIGQAMGILLFSHYMPSLKALCLFFYLSDNF